ncbi:hypothetical protein JIN85_04425 [Luteolibacter pohnpeiensis]|uniref:Methanolan biosynthesis EpsI domain-containing protein n=1 Tax=Luteolibacter pohnpeiensis TaxID=454153 RepID=A0A934VUZ1_9BACT|nr:hypothetical protein [Luteolibacter pohnpeiensis]MBK1881645.1 hypothetical protein [Luteolibacter pohnpeiensis]
MKRKILWGALIFTLIVSIIWPMIPFPGAGARLTSIPASGPGFLTEPLKLSKADQEFLGKAEAAQYLVSMKGGANLILSVIDGSNNRHAVHDPSYCFSGAGWKIHEQATLKTSSGEASWVSLIKGSQTSESLWFFDDGKTQFTSPMDYWLKTSARRATLGHSGEEPVLVTLRGLPGAPVDWDRVRQVLLPSLGFN